MILWIYSICRLILIKTIYPSKPQITSTSINANEKWYESYKDFRKYYSNSDRDDVTMDYFQFQKNPIYVIDVSKQINRLPNASITCSINMKLNNALANNMTAYTVTYFDTVWDLKGDQLTIKF